MSPRLCPCLLPLLAACVDPSAPQVKRAHPQVHDDTAGSTDTEDSTTEDSTGNDTSPPDTGPQLSTETGGGANPQGIDVSHWDDAIDWGAVADDDIGFAYVKATEGTGYRDPAFEQNLSDARAAGLYVGAYHFAVPSDSDGATQANYFVDHGGDWTGDGSTLPGSLDIEWNPYDGDDCYDLSASEMTTWIRDFVDQYTERTGRAPTIYCGQLWWSYCVNDTDFSAAPLWVASWEDASPELPAGWTDWDLWQYGAGTVDGISVDADVNVYNGSEARLAAFAAGP